MSTESTKSLGQAIDEIINALQGIEASTRLTAIKAACEHLGISYGRAATPLVSQSEGAGVPASLDTYAPPPQQRTLLDIRSLKEQKGPSNAMEMACVVAYYLQYIAPETERKTEVSNEDLDTYFRQADFPIPKRLDNLLVVAKAAGYFDSVGRGTYKLNAVGYNLVVHSLPRSGKSAHRLVSRQIAKRGNSKKPQKRRRARNKDFVSNG
jgi:hypothetical protein